MRRGLLNTEATLTVAQLTVRAGVVLQLHVRFGSKADIRVHPRDVRFTPKSGHGSAPL